MNDAQEGPLREALDAAVAAARLAGGQIRAEFERPGGPRGHGDHCPVDEEVEVLIRDALRARFPSWQFFGEETGETGEPSLYHWLVDPNDGTSAFLKGHRGSAVSIALLRDRAVVLGVVYAPCAHFGGDDLITWVEGGPVTRNGEVITRQWADALGPYDRVLLSADADKKPTLNASLVAPGRFLSVPSIAYRTALIAVGEGEAAVSVSPTSDYDFAAAHAIVAGAGGHVVDSNGRAPQYAPSGGRKVTSGGLFIAGAPNVVETLMQRPWSQVRSAAREVVPFVGPTPRPIRSSAQTVARGRGLMLGQLVGDALGAQVEFSRATDIFHRFPQGVRSIRDGGPFQTSAGQPTDDSEMALAMSRSVLRKGCFDLESVAQAYVDWYTSSPFDVGSTVSTACEAGVQADEGQRAAAMRTAARAESQANGALMRISPIALLHHADPDKAVRCAVDDARLTHPHPVCLAANAAFVAALVEGLNGGDSTSMLSVAVHAAERMGPGAVPVVQSLQKARSKAPVLDEANQGWVLLAMQNAFHVLLHAPSFEEGLVQTVSRGGDTDTVGAITGALMGALHGVSAVPKEWRGAVLTCRATSRVFRPRPMKYWPIDALFLAEALLETS
ncbi:MAG: inositol monophosphatase family protein [Myxococcota bacterium]